MVIYYALSNTEVRFNFSIQFQLQWLVDSECIFLVGEFTGIPAMSLVDKAVLGLVAITFAEFTGLVMCESMNVIRCGCRAEVSSIAFLNEV